MISSRMLPRQITSSLRAPAKLSSLHSVDCGLWVLLLRSSPFRISNLEPLFAKHPGGGTQSPRLLCRQSVKSFAAYHIPATPAFSCNCALFCAMGIRYSICFQYFTHSFCRHRGGTPSTLAKVKRLQSGHSRRQGDGVVMGNRLNGNHRIHSRSAGEGGAIHDIKVANLPSLALRISHRGVGRTADSGGAHNVKRKQREPPGLPAGRIHGLHEAAERASPPGFVGTPFGVRRKDQLRAGGCQDERRPDEAQS